MFNKKRIQKLLKWNKKLQKRINLLEDKFDNIVTCSEDGCSVLLNKAVASLKPVEAEKHKGTAYFPDGTEDERYYTTELYYCPKHSKPYDSLKENKRGDKTYFITQREKKIEVDKNGKQIENK